MKERMLNVQRYLKSGKSYQDLNAEYGILNNCHHTLPLVILNYHLIRSPKAHPIVKECRGLVLDQNHDIVAKSFDRFYNFGECQNEMEQFDFSNFVVNSKEDGSIILLYYYDKWRANTRATFGEEKIYNTDIFWHDAICEAMGIKSLDELALNKNFTYVCEFCSGYNKNVRNYEKPTMYLLSVFNKEEELDYEEMRNISLSYFSHTEEYKFYSIEEIKEYLLERSRNDASFEGVVIRDWKNRRWKIKSSSYMSLFFLKNNGDYSPKHLMPFILSGEVDELLLYFPDVKDNLFQYKARLDWAYGEMIRQWDKIKDLDGRDFAINNTGMFKSILFEVKKTNKHPEEVWKKSGKKILQKLFMVTT